MQNIFFGGIIILNSSVEVVSRVDMFDLTLISLWIRYILCKHSKDEKISTFFLIHYVIILKYSLLLLLLLLL